MEPAPAVVNQPTTFSIPLSPPATHKFHPSTPFTPYDDPRAHLEDALKRSVTVVFWYKPDSPPIRLHGEVTTFPLFQLSQFAHLAADLGLGPAAYVDAYNPLARAWEQQTISAVQAVESEQRLLFRVRKSLLEGLDDRECPSLAEEICLQPVSQSPSSNASKKRPSADTPMLMGPPVKYARVDSSPSHSDAHIVPSASTITLATPFVAVDPSSPGPSKQISSPSINSTSTQLTFQTLPLVKRWPNDYTVFELSAGFQQMDALIAQQPSLTQRSAFERIFSCRYVKSTVCRHRGVWRRAPKVLRETFEHMGQDERGLWSEFIKRIEGGTGRTDTVRSKKLAAATDAEAVPLADHDHETVTLLAPQEGQGAHSEARQIMDSLRPPPDEGE